MSLKLGNTTIAGISRETKLNAHSLLDFKWTDHILNEMSWLRADTFSWQSGDVYISVYNLLVAEYQNGIEETEGSITFKRSANGYKITTDESGVIALFNNTGVAWYYILDLENRRFKLPRTTHREIIEIYNEGENGYRIWNDGYCEQWGNFGPAFSSWSNKTITFMKEFKNTDYNVWAMTGYTVNTDSPCINVKTTTSFSCTPYNSTGNACWRACGYLADDQYSKNSLPNYKNLYFYVGEFSQTATEQTAGLNSELFNTKADISASNLNSQGKSFISGLGMPSGRYIDLTLGASGSEYTAPANGTVYFKKRNNAASGGVTNTLVNLRTGIITESYSPYTVAVNLDVEKNDVFAIYYTGNGTEVVLRFYYAEGENS